MNPSIACRPNGPYLLQDAETAILRRASGETLASEPRVALCRCGGSQKKPYCDGTHSRNGFSDQRRADPALDRRTSYAGKGITIHDNRALCAHAGACTDSLKQVFRMRQEPWIDPDAAAVEEIVATIASALRARSATRSTASSSVTSNLRRWSA